MDKTRTSWTPCSGWRDRGREDPPAPGPDSVASSGGGCEPEWACACLAVIAGEALAKHGLRDWIGLSTETLIADARQDRLKPDVMLAIHFWTGVAFLGSDLSEDTWGPNVSEVWIATDDQADYDRVLREIRERLEAVPSYVFQVKQFLSASKMPPTSSIGKQPVGGFISHATPKDATLPVWFEIFNGR